VAVAPLLASGAAFTILNDTTPYFAAELQAEKRTEATIQKAIFPAWTFALNGHEVTPEYYEGRYRLLIPAGDQILTARFMETPMETLGNMLTVSGVSASIVGIILWRSYYKKRKKTS
jgi:hypothetical protein